MATCEIDGQQSGRGPVRGRSDMFVAHYGRVRQFWESQSALEQQHIIQAFSLELTRVQAPAVREQVVAGLANIDLGLATAVANRLGMAAPLSLPNPA